MNQQNIIGKKLLILAGASVHIKVVQAAKELGVYTIVTDNLSPEYAPAKLEADEYWMINIYDIDEIVAKCKDESVDGVLAFCIDPAQIPYQQICEKLNLPCYGTSEQFKIFTHKTLFKDLCRKYNVDVIPEYSKEDIIYENVKYPVIIKPTDSRGSRGISLCYNKDEALKAIDVACAESSDNNFIIERYMCNAEDMSFAYMVVDGVPHLVKIGDRILGYEEDNLQCQHMATFLPSKHTQQYITDVEPNVKRMIKGIGMQFGSVFLQGFWEDGKVYMYDPGLRFPGSDFDVVTKSVTNFDAMKSFVNFALTGDDSVCYGDIDLAYNYNGGLCIILSVSTRSGVIGKITGLKSINEHPFIIDVSQRYKEGEFVPNTGDVRQRVLEFVAYIKNPSESKAFFDYIYSTLSIQDELGNDMIISKVKY
jgi:biotin carboxylase